METLKAGRWRPLEVVVDTVNVPEEVYGQVREFCEELDVELMVSPADELRKFCGSSEHQGLMAKMPAYPYVDAGEILQEIHSESFVLALAGIQDPFNFGSILRSADLFGVDAVIVPTLGQATVSTHVVRSSVGAVNYLKIAEVDELPTFCQKLAASGLQVVAATEQGDRSPDSVDLSRGTLLIIGNEGAGIGSDLLRLADSQVCIPLCGHVDSLNAAVAAGILCYEVRRQRSLKA